MSEHVRITGASTATSKGQTTIPKEVRDAVGIKEGTPLTWIYENGELKVRARTKRFEDFAGILGPPPNGKRATVEDMNDAVRDEAAARFRRKTAR